MLTQNNYSFCCVHICFSWAQRPKSRSSYSILRGWRSCWWATKKKGWNENKLMFVYYQRLHTLWATILNSETMERQKRMEGSERNVHSPHNSTLLFMSSRSGEGLACFSQTNRLQGLVVYFTAASLCSQRSRKCAQQFLMPQFQAPADSLAGVSPTIPIMCGRLFFSTSIGANLMQ